MCILYCELVLPIEKVNSEPEERSCGSKQQHQKRILWWSKPLSIPIQSRDVLHQLTLTAAKDCNVASSFSNQPLPIVQCDALRGGFALAPTLEFLGSEGCKKHRRNAEPWGSEFRFAPDKTRAAGVAHLHPSLRRSYHAPTNTRSQLVLIRKACS